MAHVPLYQPLTRRATSKRPLRRLALLLGGAGIPLALAGSALGSGFLQGAVRGSAGTFVDLSPTGPGVVEALGRPWVAPKPVPVAAAAAPRSAAPLSNAAFLRPPVRVSLPVELAVVTAPQLVATPVAAPRADTTPAAERAHADANLPHSAVPGLGVLFRHKGDGASTAWFAQHQPAARGDAPNNANPARDSGSFSQTSQNGDTSRAAENTTTRDHAYSRHGDSRGPGYASGQGGAGSD